MLNMSKECKISQITNLTDGAAAATALNGGIVDMQDFEGVLFIIPIGTITAGAVTSVKAQQGQASNMSDAADLLGTGQTVADTDDDKVFYIDVFRPAERYVRPVVSRGTQNAVVGNIIAIQYGAKKKSPAHGTGVAGETHISPIEGTA